METTVLRLDAVLDGLRVLVGRPRQAGWLPMSDVADPERLTAWLAEVASQVGSDDAGSSFLGGWLAAPLVRVSVAALLTDARCPSVEPDTVHVHVNPGLWVDAISFEDPRVVVLPTDRAAGKPSSQVVENRTALENFWADRIVTVVGPVFAALDDVGRFGLRGLWGHGVVDAAYDVTAELGRRNLVDVEAAADEVRSVLRALDDRLSLSLPEGRLFSVPWRGTSVPFAVKSSCCLMYKTLTHTTLIHKTQASLRRDDTHYCTGCPLISDESRAQRWNAWLG